MRERQSELGGEGGGTYPDDVGTSTQPERWAGAMHIMSAVGVVKQKHTVRHRLFEMTGNV